MDPNDNNNIRDIIFSNSPFDQFLQSLENIGDDLKGEVISFDETFNNNDDNDLANIGNKDNENQDNTIVDGKKKNSTDHCHQERKINKFEIQFLSHYETATRPIIDSDILHPSESLFITDPNLNYPNQHHNHLLSERSNQTLVQVLSVTRGHIENIRCAVQLVREIELISRGYRLSTPLTPIERLEVMDGSSRRKSEKSLILRAGVTRSIRTSISLFKTLIDTTLSSILLSNGQHHHQQQQEELNQFYKSMIKSDLSNLFNNFDDIDPDSSTQPHSQEFQPSYETQEEYDCQLPIITIKTMFYQYELMISNFFTVFILTLSKIYGINSIFTEDSINSLSPMISTMHSKLEPLKQKNNANNNNDEEDDIEISLLDILKLDELVNDFLNVKDELSSSLKNWDNANRQLVRIVRSIPTTPSSTANHLTEEESKERLNRLIERLKSHSSNYIEYEPTEKDENYKPTFLSIPLDSPDENQERVYEADGGEMDPLFPQNPQQPNPQENTDNNSTTQSSTSPLPPPPPPPPNGIPTGKKPSKRTVFDPLFKGDDVVLKPYVIIQKSNVIVCI
eukprot:gene597-743_t